MIALNHDCLVFRSPETERKLRACAEAYRDEWLPRVLSENPVAVCQQMLEQNHDWIPAEKKWAILKTAARLNRDHIAKGFFEEVMNRLDLDSLQLSVSFQRTLRLPDDEKIYPLPPGLGNFPLRDVRRYAEQLPGGFLRRGGVLMPMYQAEALWLSFDTSYPWALKIGTGLTNAVSGKRCEAGLSSGSQSYVVLPEQPWLDGYRTEKGIIRQFVASRLGDRYTAEEQLNGTSHGGLQLEAFPKLDTKRKEAA